MKLRFFCCCWSSEFRMLSMFETIAYFEHEGRFHKLYTDYGINLLLLVYVFNIFNVTFSAIVNWFWTVLCTCFVQLNKSYVKIRSSVECVIKWHFFHKLIFLFFLLKYIFQKCVRFWNCYIANVSISSCLLAIWEEIFQAWHRAQFLTCHMNWFFLWNIPKRLLYIK